MKMAQICNTGENKNFMVKEIRQAAGYDETDLQWLPSHIIRNCRNIFTQLRDNAAETPASLLA